MAKLYCTHLCSAWSKMQQSTNPNALNPEIRLLLLVLPCYVTGLELSHLIWSCQQPVGIHCHTFIDETTEALIDRVTFPKSQSQEVTGPGLQSSFVWLGCPDCLHQARNLGQQWISAQQCGLALKLWPES